MSYLLFGIELTDNDISRCETECFASDVIFLLRMTPRVTIRGNQVGPMSQIVVIELKPKIAIA
jgi:hypothetical protein